MEKELSKAISHLKSNKSPGLGNIRDLPFNLKGGGGGGGGMVLCFVQNFFFRQHES